MDKSELFCNSVLDLLKFHKSGNGAALKNLVEQARVYSNWNPGNSKFWYANFRFALEIAGFIEVVETSGSQRWCLSNSSPSFFDGKSNVTIGTKSRLNPSDESTLSICVDTPEGLTFFSQRTNTSQTPNNPSALSRIIIDSFPDASTATSEVCDIVMGGPPTAKGRWEIFNFSNGTQNWEEFDGGPDPQPGLYRSWDLRTGTSVWAFDRSGYSSKISYPEWTFLISSKKLGIDWTSLLRFNGRCVEVPRQVRLPRLLLKILFCLSDSVKISWKVEFHGVRPADFHELIKRIEKKGF